MLALLSFFDRFGLVRFRKHVHTCTGCANCQRNCPVDIRSVHYEKQQQNVMSPECMACMKCAEACPVDGTLTFRWWNWTLFRSSFSAVAKRVAGRQAK